MARFKLRLVLPLSSLLLLLATVNDWLLIQSWLTFMFNLCSNLVATIWTAYVSWLRGCLVLSWLPTTKSSLLMATISQDSLRSLRNQLCSHAKLPTCYFDISPTRGYHVYLHQRYWCPRQAVEQSIPQLLNNYYPYRRIQTMPTVSPLPLISPSHGRIMFMVIKMYQPNQVVTLVSNKRIWDWEWFLYQKKWQQRGG